MPVEPGGGWIDVIRMRQFIREQARLRYPIGAAVVMEHVWSLPGEGVASAHSFGRALGAIKAVLELEVGPVFLVRPVTWKRHFGLIGKDKEASRQLALQRWPVCRHFLQRKLDHQRAEALLIADWYNQHLTTEMAA
jgi:crossover junction endodeoxyribonuclease RuvC